MDTGVAITIAVIAAIAAVFYFVFAKTELKTGRRGAPQPGRDDHGVSSGSWLGSNRGRADDVHNGGDSGSSGGGGGD